MHRLGFSDPSADVRLISTPFGGALSIRPALELSRGETWTAEGTGGPLREKTTAKRVPACLAGAVRRSCFLIHTCCMMRTSFALARHRGTLAMPGTICCLAYLQELPASLETLDVTKELLRAYRLIRLFSSSRWQGVEGRIWGAQGLGVF